jgi:ADP-ribose pyrophosphatase YjhB (NUDIX family)
VVVCAFENGRMLLSWHRGHRAWETQGGHIEANETPEEAARRELYEESGVTRAELLPVCDYYAFDSEGESNGRVFAARVLEREALPEYEMQKVQAFECLPEDLTYPRVTPVLFREAAEIARKTEPGGLLLTHFSTSMEDPEEYLPAAREIFERTWAAKDGQTVVIRYPEGREKAWTSLC